MKRKEEETFEVKDRKERDTRNIFLEVDKRQEW
jgi:hypothetical protein